MSNRLWTTFQQLTSIYSPSYGERQFCDALRQKLTQLNISVYEDDADQIIKGNSGNLYGFLPGTLSGPPLLFSAHMDTVEPAKGKKPILHEDGTITSAGDTILGADDAAGITIILEAIARLKEQGIPHRTIELVFPVAEERYGAGSAVIDYSRIRARDAYVLDLGGAIGEAANAAPTILSFEIQIHGKAAHAGFAPREGIHAIEAAAKAIARLPQGEPAPGFTFNIGRIEGGGAGNIVPALCTVRGEMRSLDHKAVLAYWETVKTVFHQEAANIGAIADAKHKIELTAYETPLHTSVVERFERACQKTGVPCHIHSTFGGSDQNNFALHGINGLVIACSMHEVHSNREHSHLDELESGVKLVIALMTD